MEFYSFGTGEYKRRSGEQSESFGRYPGSDLHIRNVLSIRADRCAGQGKGEDGPSKRPQKIGCYVQKCAVICAVTEDVNLSWEGR